MDIEERIKAIEEEIRTTPYNKATQHHIGKLKAKLARLKDELQKRSAGGKGKRYGIKKSGDATAVLVGFPSVGKSTLINRLTSANSEVGSYDFTTLGIIPGMMLYRGAKIQILDIPGLIRGASSGKGRGRAPISIARNADVLINMIDVFNLQQFDIIKKELHDSGIRLDEKPPDIKIKRKSAGGISISSTVPLTKLSSDEIKAVLHEYKLHNCEVVIREDVTIERFIDSLQGNRAYIPSITVLNKMDLVTGNYLDELKSKISDFIPISALKGENINALKDTIFKKLNLICIYMKPRDGEADMDNPLILKRGARIEQVCERIHRDFKERFRYAKVWGISVKFQGQRVGLEHIVEDGDIVSIVI